MREMTSSVGSSPAPLTNTGIRQTVAELKKRQDDATARMGSDTVGVLGTADPDFYGFVTDTFKGLKPVTVLSGNGSYGTLAILPDQHHATLEDRYYNPGTAFVVDRAGTATTGLNILRSGPPPAGYYGGNKLMVQTRQKRYFTDGTGFTYRWEVGEVRSEPKDYALQPDEQLDGSFYPGSIRWGVAQPYGWTFPTADNGQMLYNPDPMGTSGWSGAVNTVPNDPATAPVITSISPTSYTIGDPAASIVITGSNFTDCGFVMFGPFLPANSGGIEIPPDTTTDPVTGDIIKHRIQVGGGYLYRTFIDDNTVAITTPTNLEPGVWDIILVGSDGQIARSEGAFTVLAGS